MFIFGEGAGMANVKNNKRRRETRRRIEAALADLLDETDLEHVTVSAICERAAVNRGSFYANYHNVQDLAAQLAEWTRVQVKEIFEQDCEGANDADFNSRLFAHIYENQDAYRLFFKLGLDTVADTYWSAEQAQRYFGAEHAGYHAIFFRAGMTALIRAWLDAGCPETPEEMAQIVHIEYHGRTELSA